MVFLGFALHCVPPSVDLRQLCVRHGGTEQFLVVVRRRNTKRVVGPRAWDPAGRPCGGSAPPVDIAPASTASCVRNSKPGMGTLFPKSHAHQRRNQVPADDAGDVGRRSVLDVTAHAVVDPLSRLRAPLLPASVGERLGRVSGLLLISAAKNAASSTARGALPATRSGVLQPLDFDFDRLSG